jgi:hypothetical protein
MLLTTTIGEAIEVTVTFGLILLTLGVMAAIPFAVQYFVDDQRPPEE